MGKRSNRPRRYRVTQPAVHNAGVAAYPEQTTRIDSNDRYILASNHPEWYEIAAKHEAGLLRLMNRDRLRSEFPLALESTAAVTPFHAYGLVLLQLMGEFLQKEGRGYPEIHHVFNSAVGTVISNLSQIIFADPQTLRGVSYTALDFAAWQERFEQYQRDDRFVYRPGESGMDVDGTTKPILEVCPTPRLGRHLVECGYEILVEHVASKSKQTLRP
jgi:hypothetical protein